MQKSTNSMIGARGTVSAAGWFFLALFAAAAPAMAQGADAGIAEHTDGGTGELDEADAGPPDPGDGTGEAAEAEVEAAAETAVQEPATTAASGGDAEGSAAGADAEACGPRTRCGHTPRPAPSEVSFRGTETFITEYVGDNGPGNESSYGDDDNYWIYRNLFYLQASNRYFDSAIRLDATFFHNPPRRVEMSGFVPGGDGYTTLNYGNDVRIERLHGTAHIDNLHITGGDFYVNFGRGLALSLIKLDDVGVDNALRGARVEYQVPRKLKFILVGGLVNSLNIDPITKQVQEDDPLDRIVGARAEWEIADALSLGVHGVVMRPRFEQESDIDPARIYVDRGTGVGVLTGGGTAELHLGGAHVYLEGNGQSHDNYRPEGEDVLNESGYAAFGEVSYDLSPFMLKGEGIFYRRWLMDGPIRGTHPAITSGPPIPYHHIPTLEPIWMIIMSLGNAEGGRLTGDLYLRDSDTQLSLLTSLINYEGGLLSTGEWDDHPETLIVHPILRLRQGFGDSGIQAAAEGGFRYEKAREEVPAGHDDSGHLWHLMIDVSVPITGPHSVEVKHELRRHQLAVTESTTPKYWIAMTTLGYEQSGVFGVALIHEYSDQTPPSDAMIGNWTLPFPDHNFLWAMITAHMPEPIDGLTLRLIGGSQRGGIKCAGGVCRVYPDAVGARLEAVYRF